MRKKKNKPPTFIVWYVTVGSEIDNWKEFLPINLRKFKKRDRKMLEVTFLQDFITSRLPGSPYSPIVIEPVFLGVN